jgi:hypothetical protein
MDPHGHASGFWTEICTPADTSSLVLILARITQDACKGCSGYEQGTIDDTWDKDLSKMKNSAYLELELVRQVQTRTGRRIRDLAVELQSERIVLRGYAASYYLKQLAQHGVQEMLPHVRLENAITVN